MRGLECVWAWILGAMPLLLSHAAVPARAQLEAGKHIPVDIVTPWDYTGTTSMTAELRWRDELSASGATYIAIHFTAFDLGAGDYLIVSDPTRRQTYTLEGRGKMGAGAFWSQHVKGDTVLLELVVVSEQGGQGFWIDEYVAGHVDLGPTPGQRAVCGADDKENAVCYEASHPSAYDHARAVARLLINGSRLCTGWLVSADDHLMTNEHCIASSSDATNTDYEFMAEAPHCPDSNCPLCHAGMVFSGATFIKASADLDYALVQLDSGGAAAAYGHMEIDDRAAIVGEQIYIPQHPLGRAKELGIYSTHGNDAGGVCRVYSITENPCSGSGYNDIGYYCDTEGGSSGSPVLATSSHGVIALHHCADCPNRGVPIHLIYPEISQYLTTPAGLKVIPADSLAAEGPAGGPFVPGSIVYTLHNLNDTGIQYAITNGESWVSLSDTEGYLAGHVTRNVTVSINSNADMLPNGIHSDTVNFVNITDHHGDTTRAVTLTVGVPTVQYAWNMDIDPGWQTQGLWAWGQPTGGGGQYGGPDPTSGCTGSNVYGYNLNGDYENGLSEAHLTSTAIDCTALLNVTLRFQRWLGVEHPAHDHAYVRVSHNGTDWTTVWENSAQLADSSWVFQEFDVSAVADGQPTVFLRWTMGATDGSWRFCGWNIDDVEVWGIPSGLECHDDGDCDDANDCTADVCEDGVCRNDCPTTVSWYPYIEGFESGFGDWINVADDDMDWTQNSGSTSSSGTGPASAHRGSYYLYTEASYPNYPNKTATLEGPCLDLAATTDAELVFWYHMYGSNTGTLSVEVSQDCVSWTTVWSLSGEQGDSWYEASVALTPYSGTVIKMRFRGVTGSSYRSDMSIDDLSVDVTPVLPCHTDEDCDDGVYCNGMEICVEEVCRAGGYPCPGQACNEETNTCEDAECVEDEDCNDQNDCTVDVCVDFVCLNEWPGAVSSYPYTESFENGLGNWVNVANDDIDWTRNSGPTPSSSTGPAGARDGFYYVYTEASAPNCPDKTATLEGPSFNLLAAADAELTFWYHMYGSSMGNLSVEVSQDCLNWTTVWSLSGDQGDSWYEAVVDLTPYTGAVIKMRFRGVTGARYQSDMAIDGVSVEIVSVLPCDSDEDCDDGLYCNGGETCVDHLCRAGVDPCPGQDCDEMNNRCVTGPGFEDGFENGNVSGWNLYALGSTASGGHWEIGDPDGTTFDGNQAQPEYAFAGTGCVFTARNTSLGSGDVDGGVVYLVSPRIDLSGASSAELRFVRWFYNRDVGEDPGDFFVAQVSDDNGTSWVTLETLDTNQSVNTWTERSFTLEGFISLNSRVRLRFGASDGSSSDNIIEAAIDSVAVNAD